MKIDATHTPAVPRTSPRRRAPKPWALPKTIGACVDALFTIRQDRLEAQKAIDTLKAREATIREHLIATLPKSDETGAAGRIARAQIHTKLVPQVDDWDALYRHIKRTGEFDLLQRRLTDSAVQDRWDEGKIVKGIGSFNLTTVSVTKL